MAGADVRMSTTASKHRRQININDNKNRETQEDKILCS